MLVRSASNGVPELSCITGFEFVCVVYRTRKQRLGTLAALNNSACNHISMNGTFIKDAQCARG